MHTTIYLHPLRTILARWDTDNDIPVLVSYNELMPDDDVRASLDNDSPCTVAVHASTARWHHFPVDDDENLDLRIGFEIASCLPDINPDRDTVVLINNQQMGQGRTWCGMSIIPRQLADSIAQRVGPAATIVPDVVCDVHTALTCVPRQENTWAFVGLRGDRWIAAVIGQQHTVIQCAAFPRDATTSFVDGLLESFYAIRSAGDGDINHVLVFGDDLTKDRFDSVADHLRRENVHTARLQPFRRVGARVDDDTKRRLLSMSHLMGPLVAPVLPYFSKDVVGANP